MAHAKKVMTCPQGFSLKKQNPKTGRTFKRPTCVKRTKVGGAEYRPPKTKILVPTKCESGKLSKASVLKMPMCVGIVGGKVRFTQPSFPKKEKAQIAKAAATPGAVKTVAAPAATGTASERAFAAWHARQVAEERDTARFSGLSGRRRRRGRGRRRR